MICGVAWATPDKASGTLNYKGKAVNLGHAYLIKGPDSVDPATVIRRLVLTKQDIGAKLQGCKTMSCVDGEVTEGLIVDLLSGPRFGYWVAINGAMIQYSGTLRPSVLQASTDDDKRLAGKLSFDDGAAGGPKVEVEFDASMLKELAAAR